MLLSEDPPGSHLIYEIQLYSWDSVPFSHPEGGSIQAAALGTASPRPLPAWALTPQGCLLNPLLVLKRLNTSSVPFQICSLDAWPPSPVPSPQ